MDPAVPSKWDWGMMTGVCLVPSQEGFGSIGNNNPVMSGDITHLLSLEKKNMAHASTTYSWVYQTLELDPSPSVS